MTLLLEHGDIPGFKVGRRRRRHEKRGGAWVRGHRVSGLVQRRSEGASGLIAKLPSTARLDVTVHPDGLLFEFGWQLDQVQQPNSSQLARKEP